MTITTTTLRAQYNGNGVTTSFAVPFEFLEGSTVKVILTSVAGVDTTKTITTHYTVTGGGTVQPATGSVVMITPPATGEKLTILRAQPLTQAASYTEGDAFPAKTHEKALDRQAMEVQMLAERTNRALKLKETSANADLIFPEPDADKVVGWNAVGTALENKALTDLEDGLYGVIDEDDMASDSATKVPTQQSVKAYADTKLNTETGALDQAQTGFFLETDGARIHRVADRLMIADAVAYPGGSSAGSWLETQGAGSSTMRWIEARAYVASVGTTGIGVTGAISNQTAGGTSIGLVGFAVSNEDVNSWGAYIEGVRAAGTALGKASAAEFDITNLNSTPVPDLHPYANMGLDGTATGIWIASGGDPNVNPVTYDANFALGIGANGAKFLRGLIFTNGGLTRDGGATGRAHAIQMAYDQAIEWYEFTTSTLGLSIVSQVTDAAHKQELRIADAGMSLLNSSGDALFFASWAASAVNGIEVRPAATGVSPRLQAIGSDTHVDLLVGSKGGNSVVRLATGNGFAMEFNAVASAVTWLRTTGQATGGRPLLSAQGNDTNITGAMRGKGTGGWRFEDGGLGVKFEYNTTGIGFFGAAPVARPTGVAVTAAGIHAALVALGLITA